MSETDSLAVFNFMPHYCPQCARPLKLNYDTFSRQDWEAGCAHSCECGLKYQKVNTDTIIGIADDIRYYVKGK